MKKWLCIICGLIYDEAKGWPADGILPGTRWEDVPDDWVCPDCGVSKSDFQMLDITPASASDTIAEQEIKKQAPIVIIGSGHAGYSLAETLRERDPQREILVFTSDGGASYSKPALSNALSRDKTAKQLITETVLDLEARLNIRIHANCEVNSIDSEQHLVHTSLGTQAYSKLVLAVGAEPIRLKIAGDCNQDILSINDLQSYAVFREQLSESRHVTIIGNGLIGCEFANDLANKGFKVSVIGLTAWPMDRLIPREMGQQLQANLAANNVTWYLENTIAHAEKREQGMRLTLNDGQVFETDVLISAIGLRPRMALAKAAGIDCNLGIKVNGGLRTNTADIYALGDCAEINGQLLPYIAPINFAVRALADCLLGRPTMAQYPLMPVLIKTPAYPLNILTPPANSDGQWKIEKTADGTRGLFLSKDGDVLGFALSEKLVSERQQWTDQVALTRC